MARSKVLPTLSNSIESPFDTCARLKKWNSFSPSNTFEAQQQYDSLRYYVERCSASDTTNFLVFNSLNGAVVVLDSKDTLRYMRYREWLISVLYLNNTNFFYFCSCIYSIAGTYQYGKIDPTLATLGILDYMRKNHKECYGSAQERAFTQDSIEAHKEGNDPTHLPSLEDLGLGFLLTHNSVSPSTVLPTIYLVSFTSSPNPFKTETTLTFELNRMAYVTVEVFDPLGRKVWGDDHGYSLDKGIHTVHLDGSKFSSGAYYARISTGFGEVKTLKLVKQ